MSDNTNTLVQRSPEWFNARLGRITGSMAGACLGLAPYMTPEQAMRSMVRGYHKAPSEFEGNIATEYGVKNEDGAIWAYEMETENTVSSVGFYTKDDWLGASPDGQVSPIKGLEVKCPFGLRNDEKPVFKTAADQPHYFLQMQLEMHCAGWTEIDFWQWTPYDTKLETITLDMEYLDAMLLELRAFYELYLIEIDNPEHLEPLKKEINTNLAFALAGEYDDVMEARDNADQRLSEIKEELVELANGKSAIIGGKSVTKISKKGAVKWAGVAKKFMPKDYDTTPFLGKSSEYWKVG